MTKKIREVVIPKEDAVFWMDGNGRWHNEHGEFEHPKIINYFHMSIHKDDIGYYLSHIKDDCLEKVYFRYEKTALFVFDVLRAETITLVLNTKKQIKLKPKKLSIKNDALYMHVGKELIKFTDRSLIKISDLIEYDENKYFIRINNRRYEIEKGNRNSQFR